MPVRAAESDRFDDAITRLAEISSPAARAYIADHQCRCIDDVLRLSELSPGTRILNVGGWPYLFEFIARELQLDVDTLDIAPERTPDVVAQLAGRVRKLNIEEPEARTTLDLKAYDVICMAEIFEHMRIDLVATFRHLSASLRADAVLYLTTPNFFYAASLFKALMQGRSGPSLVDEWRKIDAGGHMGHVREYSRRELVEFFTFTGFKVERLLVRNSRRLSLRAGGWSQVPARLLANALATHFNCFGQELVFVLRPIVGSSNTPQQGG